MFKYLLALTLCVAVMGLTGCSEESSTVPDIPQSSASDVVKTAPESSGPNVARYDGIVFYWDYVDDMAATFVFGIDPATMVCGDEPMVTYPIMDVTNPRDPSIVHELIHDTDVPVYIYDGYWQPSEEDPDCGFFADGLLYWGSGALSSTDNDYYAYFPPESSRVNSYHHAFNARLAGADGSRAVFHNLFQVTWTGYPDYQIQVLFSKARLLVKR